MTDIQKQIDEQIAIVEKMDKVITANEGHAEDGDLISQAQVVNAQAEFNKACDRISSMGLIDFAVALRHGKDNIDGKIF
tara:strand:+ start:75 stop:311 length:237 start_codon:yes stop_codon:yes gene_type:complete